MESLSDHPDGRPADARALSGTEGDSDHAAAFDLRHLRYFVVVAEELHFRRAAQRLHMAQPPLSQAIRQLEAAIGGPLLVRTSRHVELTAAGRVFYERALGVLDAVDTAAGDTRRALRLSRGLLAAGYVSAGTTAFAALVDAHRVEHPDTRVVGGEMLYNALAQHLHRREIDVGFALLPLDGSSPAGLVAQPLDHWPVFAGVRTDHPLAGRDSVDPREVMVGRFISRIPAQWRRDVLFERIGVAPDVHEVESLQAALDLVAGGGGFCLTSAEYSREGLTFVPVKGLTVRFGALTRADEGSQSVRDLLATAKRIAVHVPGA